MTSFLSNLRSVTIGGFFFLLPVYILFIVITKAWTSLSSIGARVAGMFGMKSILGVGGSTVFSGLLLIVIWIACGLLVRFSFVAAFNNRLEGWLSKYVPGYSSYKAIAEEKLKGEVRKLSYGAVLIKRQEYWQPAYMIEQDGNGNYVIFLPGAPDTNTGRILLAKQEQVRLLTSITANQLDASLKKMGKGLLTEFSLASDKL